MRISRIGAGRAAGTGVPQASRPPEMHENALWVSCALAERRDPETMATVLNWFFALALESRRF